MILVHFRDALVRDFLSDEGKIFSSYKDLVLRDIECSVMEETAHEVHEKNEICIIAGCAERCRRMTEHGSVTMDEISHLKDVFKHALERAYAGEKIFLPENKESPCDMECVFSEKIDRIDKIDAVKRKIQDKKDLFAGLFDNISVVIEELALNPFMHEADTSVKSNEIDLRVCRNDEFFLVEVSAKISNLEYDKIARHMCPLNSDASELGKKGILMASLLSHAIAFEIGGKGSRIAALFGNNLPMIPSVFAIITSRNRK